MNKFEYEFLLGKWEGPPGAALNQVYEYCVEEGWCDYQGNITPKGQKAISEYEG